MATQADLLNRIRLEIGDQSEPFRQTYRGTGFQNQFDLPAERVSATGLSVFKTYPQTLVNTTLVLNTDFTLDDVNGIISLTAPLEKDWMLTAQGDAFGMFTDLELGEYLADAIIQHTSGNEHDTVRYRDSHGFIRYDKVATTLANLPAIEELPVVVLASQFALWTLLTDAATDIDITSAEGTHIPRSQRFAQLESMIAALTDRYKSMCALLGVGLYRVEVTNLRRVSRQTGRLVPVYVEREYDENTLPERIVPNVDTRDADPDGPPSPAGNMMW